MSRFSGLDRRALLRGLGAGAALAPLCPPSVASAQAARPRRLVILHTPNGIGLMERWRPKGTETSFTLGETLAPLDPHRNDLVVLDGVDSAVYRAGPGGHSAAMPELLTGHPALRPGEKTTTRAAGISVDQHVANAISAGVRFHSLQLGVQVIPERLEYGLADAYMVYRGAGQPVMPESNPYSAFDRVFANLQPAVGAAPGGLDQVRADRRSMLDFVRADLDRLGRRLGAADRHKLQSHLEAVRAIERELSTPAMPTAAACVPPARPAGQPLDWKRDASIPAVNKLQMDIIVAALACDLTRVATLQWGGTEWPAVFSWVKVTRGHHSLNHVSPADIDGTVAVNRWAAEQLGYLIGRLKAIQEGDGTLLDRTLVLWVNEMGDGAAHAATPIPVVMAGGAKLGIRGGRYLRFGTRVSMNDVLTSVCNAMGVPNEKFGGAAFCKGPVPGLVG